MDQFSNTSWLTDELKADILEEFQPSYDHHLTEAEIINIANSLTNITEQWIKFNWRIDHDQPSKKDYNFIEDVEVKID